jgi:YspA, cpYpsA-related SLOG family
MKFGVSVYKVAIIGSRSFEDYELLKEVVGKFGRDFSIVSGGAAGADRLAERYATEFGKAITVFKPDWNRYGRGAGMVRNKQIIAEADAVFAFWDGSSKGTKNSIELAKKADKPIRVVTYK